MGFYVNMAQREGPSLKRLQGASHLEGIVTGWIVFGKAKRSMALSRRRRMPAVSSNEKSGIRKRICHAAFSTKRRYNGRHIKAIPPATSSNSLVFSYLRDYS